MKRTKTKTVMVDGREMTVICPPKGCVTVRVLGRRSGTTVLGTTYYDDTLLDMSEATAKFYADMGRVEIL